LSWSPASVSAVINPNALSAMLSVIQRADERQVQEGKKRAGPWILKRSRIQISRTNPCSVQAVAAADSSSSLARELMGPETQPRYTLHSPRKHVEVPAACLDHAHWHVQSAGCVLWLQAVPLAHAREAPTYLRGMVPSQKLKAQTRGPSSNPHENERCSAEVAS
jgi:hypothetical protein